MKPKTKEKRKTNLTLLEVNGKGGAMKWKSVGPLWLPLLRWPISDSPVQKLRFGPRHFGTTFSVVSAKCVSFSKAHFSKIEACHRKTQIFRCLWPKRCFGQFFESTIFCMTWRFRGQKPKAPILPAVLGILHSHGKCHVHTLKAAKQRPKIRWGAHFHNVAQRRCRIFSAPVAVTAPRLNPTKHRTKMRFSRLGSYAPHVWTKAQEQKKNAPKSNTTAYINWRVWVVCVCAHTFVCLCVCERYVWGVWGVCVCVFARTFACMRESVCVCVCMRESVCVRVCVCVLCVCVCVVCFVCVCVSRLKAVLSSKGGDQRRGCDERKELFKEELQRAEPQPLQKWMAQGVQGTPSRTRNQTHVAKKGKNPNLTRGHLSWEQRPPQRVCRLWTDQLDNTKECRQCHKQPPGPSTVNPSQTRADVAKLKSDKVPGKSSFQHGKAQTPSEVPIKEGDQAETATGQVWSPTDNEPLLRTLQERMGNKRAIASSKSCLVTSVSLNISRANWSKVRLAWKRHGDYFDSLSPVNCCTS